jgi:hypothetical protein
MSPVGIEKKGIDLQNIISSLYRSGTSCDLFFNIYENCEDQKIHIHKIRTKKRETK